MKVIWRWIEEPVHVNSQGNTFCCGSLINHSYMKIPTLQHFQFVQTKQCVTNSYMTNKMWLFKTWLNRNWCKTRQSVTLLTKIFWTIKQNSRDLSLQGDFWFFSGRNINDTVDNRELIKIRLSVCNACKEINIIYNNIKGPYCDKLL